MGFFDKFSNAVGSVSKDAKKAVLDGTERVRCNSVIQECDKKIKDIFEEIGRIYYTENTETPEGRYVELFKEVKQNLEIKETMNKRIIELKGNERCPECGAELKKEFNFCDHCGARIERIIQEVESSNVVYYCPFCGEGLEGTEVFCSGCGRKTEFPQEQEVEPVLMPQDNLIPSEIPMKKAVVQEVIEELKEEEPEIIEEIKKEEPEIVEEVKEEELEIITDAMLLDSEIQEEVINTEEASYEDMPDTERFILVSEEESEQKTEDVEVIEESCAINDEPQITEDISDSQDLYDEPVKELFCYNCGKKIDEEAAFCKYCGAPQKR